MLNLCQEIELFNPSISLVATPRWLTRPEKRAGKMHSSVVIAVRTMEEALPILKKGLLVLGQKVKTERYTSTKLEDQCPRCQGFGHHPLCCCNVTKCRICAGSHETRFHICNMCKRPGKVCSHVTLKCTNCGLGHKSNDPSCGVILKLRNSPRAEHKDPGDQNRI
jgi:hypothetical protein